MLGTLVAAAPSPPGALLGFVFGIPRAFSSDGLPRNTGTPSPPGVGGSVLRYQPNTNLEQISDWLTKVLVGVGLVQLGRLADAASDAITFVGPALSANETAGRVVAGAVLTYFLIAGFLIAYIATRVWLQRILADGDRDASNDPDAEELSATD